MTEQVIIRSPGDVFRYYLRGLNVNDAGRRMGWAASNVQALIDGDMRITPTIASDLAEFCQTSPDYWIDLQKEWDATLGIESDEPDGFRKNDSNKPRPALLPPLALLSISKVLAHGAEKYDAENWAKTPSLRRYADAALRHILAWLAGEDIDPESGMTHIAEAMCSLLFIEELQQRGFDEIDDRFSSDTDKVIKTLDFLIGGSRLNHANSDL